MYENIDFTQTDTSGFYNPDARLRAGKFVYGPGFSLTRETKDSFTYPVNGWTWYDDVFSAIAGTGVELQDWNLDLVNPIFKE